MKNEFLILCDNFKLLRKTNGLSQKEMAKLCGIGIGSLRKMEKGEFPPRLTMEPIFKASRYFKIPPAKLFAPLGNTILAKEKDVLYNK